MAELLYRREFLNRLSKLGLLIGGAALTFDLTNPAKIMAALAEPTPRLGIAEKGSPEALTRKAVELLGGMKQFVKSGERVLIKPNLSWDRTPELAANTNPEVLRTVILLCIESGAKDILIIDQPCNDPRRCYMQSGANQMVEKLADRRVRLEHIDERRFKTVNIVKGKSLTSWPIYQDVYEVDKVVSVPIAKHHSAARLTLSMKNVMGFLGGTRAQIHDNLEQNLADLNTVIKPNLIIMDAYRILKANGPQGGALRDVAMPQQVIAGTDPVAVDSYSATLFGLKGEEIGYVRLAAEAGLGQIDLNKVDLRKASLG